MNWQKYAYIGETITTKIEVTKIDGKLNRVWIDVICTNQNDEVILTGEGEIMPPTKEMKGVLNI